MRSRQRCSLRTLALACVALSVLPAMQDASAGPSCTFPFCSQTVNWSGVGVYVGRDWCNSNFRFRRGNAYPCRKPDVNYRQTNWLDDGESTPSRQDWDSFRVDRGWKYGFTIYNWAGEIPYVVDRRSRATGMWVRVHGDELAVVEWQCSRSVCYD